MMSVYTGKNRFLTLDQKIFAGDKQITKIYSDNELIYPAAGGTKKGIYHNVQRLTYIAKGDYRTNKNYGRSTGGMDITEREGDWMISVDVTFLIDVTIEEIPVYGYTYDLLSSNFDGYSWGYTPVSVNGTALRVYPEDSKRNDIPCVGTYTGYNDYREWPQYWNSTGRYSHDRAVDRSQMYNYKKGFYHNVYTTNTNFTSEERTYYSKYISAYRQLYNTFTFESGSLHLTLEKLFRMAGSHNEKFFDTLREGSSRLPANRVPNDVILADGMTITVDMTLEQPAGKVNGWRLYKAEGSYANSPKGTTWPWPQEYSWEEDSTRSYNFTTLKRQKFDFT